MSKGTLCIAVLLLALALPYAYGAPSVSLLSPENSTYATYSVNLTYDLSGASQCRVELDGINLSYPVCANTTLTYVHYNDTSKVLALDFAEGTGSTAYDRSRYSNNVTLVSASWNPNGWHGRALTLDGSATYATLTSALSSQIGNNITVVAWAYSNVTTGQYRAILEERYAGDGNIQFYIGLGTDTGGTTDKLCAGFYNGAWRQVCDGVAFQPHQWHFVAATYNGSMIRLYRDGFEVANGSPGGSLPVGTNGWYIGRRHDTSNGDHKWSGHIDDLAVYNRTLGVGEIQSLYFEHAFTGAHNVTVWANDSSGWNSSSANYTVLPVMPEIFLNVTALSPLGALGIRVTEAANCTISVYRPDGYVESFNGTLNGTVCVGAYIPTFLNGTYSVNATVNGTSATNTKNFTVAPSWNPLIVSNFSVNATAFYKGDNLRFTWQMNDSAGAAVTGFGTDTFDPYINTWSHVSMIQVRRQILNISDDGTIYARLSVTYSANANGVSDIIAGTQMNITVYGRDGRGPVPAGITVQNGTINAGTQISSAITNSSGVLNWTTQVTSGFNGADRTAYIDFIIPPDESLSDIVFSVNSIIYKYTSSYDERIYIGERYISDPSFLGGDDGDVAYSPGDTFSTIGRFPIYLTMNPGDNEGFLYQPPVEPYLANIISRMTASGNAFQANFTVMDTVKQNYSVRFFADKWGYPKNVSATLDLTFNDTRAGANLTIANLTTNSSSYFPGETMLFTWKLNETAGRNLTGFSNRTVDNNPNSRDYLWGSWPASLEVRRQIMAVDPNGTITVRLIVEFDNANNAVANFYAGTTINMTIYGSDGLSPVPESIVLSNGSSNSGAVLTQTLLNNSGVYSWSNRLLGTNTGATRYSYLEFIIPANHSLSDVVFSVDFINLTYEASYDDFIIIGATSIGNSFPDHDAGDSGDDGTTYFMTGDTFGSLGEFPLYLTLNPSDNGLMHGFLLPYNRSFTRNATETGSGGYRNAIGWNDYGSENYTYYLYADKWGYNHDFQTRSLNYSNPDAGESISIQSVLINASAYFPSDALNFSWRLLDGTGSALAAFRNASMDPDVDSYRSNWGSWPQSLEIRRRIINVSPDGAVLARLSVEFDSSPNAVADVYAGTQINISLRGGDGLSALPAGITVTPGNESAATYLGQTLADVGGILYWSTNVTTGFNGRARSTYLDILVPPERSLSDVIISVDGIRFLYSSSYDDRIYIGSAYAQDGGFYDEDGDGIMDDGTLVYTTGSPFGSLGEFPIRLPLSPAPAGYVDAFLSPAHDSPRRNITSSASTYQAVMSWQDVGRGNYSFYVYADRYGLGDGFVAGPNLSFDTSRVANLNLSATSNMSYYAPGQTARFTVLVNDTATPLSGFNNTDWNGNSYGTNYYQSFEIRRSIINITPDGTMTARLTVEFDTSANQDQPFYANTHVNISIFGRDGSSPLPADILLVNGSTNATGYLNLTLINSSGYYVWRVLVNATMQRAVRSAHLDFVIPPGRSLSDVVVSVDGLLYDYGNGDTDRLSIGNAYVENSGLYDDDADGVGDSGYVTYGPGAPFAGMGTFPIRMSMAPGSGALYLRATGSSVAEPTNSSISDSSGTYTLIHNWSVDSTQQLSVNVCANKYGYANDSWSCTLAQAYDRPRPIITAVNDTTGQRLPADVGDAINFTVNWTLVQEPSEQARIHVCNSTSITASGCAEKTFCSSSFSVSKYQNCSYTAENITSRMNYWVRVCTDSQSCSDIAADTFYVNTTGNPPLILSNYTTPSRPHLYASTTLSAEVTDYDGEILSVNFTIVAPNGTSVISNVNGSRVGDIWSAPAVNLTLPGRWNFTIVATDEIGRTDTSTGQIRFLDVHTIFTPAIAYTNRSLNISGWVNWSNGTPVSQTSVFIFLNGSQVIGGAGWANAQWRARQAFNVTETTGASLTDYPVRIVVDTATLVAGGKLNANCSDIRFANAAGAFIPHWLQSGCNSSSTVIWVKANLTGGTNTQLSLYYSNPAAASASNITATFPFGDDFDDGTIDSSLWVGGTGFTESGGYLHASSTQRLRSVLAFTGSYVLETRHNASVEAGNGHQIGGWYGSSGNGLNILQHPTQCYFVRNDGGWSGCYAFNYINEWLRVIVRANGSTSATAMMRESDSAWSNLTWSNSGLSGEYVNLGLRNDDGAAGQAYTGKWDYVFVRPYLSSEPTQQAFGGEDQGLMTDSQGAYLLNTTAPGARGAYEVVVNASEGLEFGQRTMTLTVYQPPRMDGNGTVPRAYSNGTVVLQANVTDDNLHSVNFTLKAPNGTIIIDNVNGTGNGSTWNSSAIFLDAVGRWNYTVAATDLDGVTTTSEGQIRFLDISLDPLARADVNDTVTLSGHVNDSLALALAGVAVNVRYNGVELWNDTIPWANSSFPYRLRVDLTERSGAPLSNHSVLIPVPTAGLIASGNLSGSCTDMRAYGAAGTPLPLWVASGCNTSNTSVWVNADLGANATAPVFIYYGGGAASSGDGRSVNMIYEPMNATPAGTLSGSATYNATGAYVQLTPATGGQLGDLQYSAVSAESGYLATFQFYAAGDQADAVWFYAYATSSGGSEDTANGGYSIVYDERDDQIQFKWNGTTLNTSAETTIDNGQWHNATIRYYGNRTEIYYDGVLRINHSDAARAKTGNYFGWGARTGFYVNAHRIRNLTVRKYAASEPDISASVWERAAITNATGGYRINITAPLSAGDYPVVASSDYGVEYGQATKGLEIKLYPTIRWNRTDQAPYYLGFMKVQANVTDDNIHSVNFTIIAPNGSLVVDNANGSSEGDLWNSSVFQIDAKGRWNYSIVALDLDGNVDRSNGSITFLDVGGSLDPMVVDLNQSFNLTGGINDSQGDPIPYHYVAVYVNGSQLCPEGWRWCYWPLRRNITINASEVNGTLTDITIAVRLPNDSSLAQWAQDDGDDLLFSLPDGTKLSHDIELFNGTTGDLVAWVRMPNLTNTTNQSIQLYYGNLAAARQENKSGAWQDEYRGVWHLSGFPGTAIDSSASGHNATAYNMTSANMISGIIDGGYDFETSDKNVLRVPTLRNMTNLSFEGMTLEAWVNVESLDPGYPHIMERWTNGGNGGWLFYACDVYVSIVEACDREFKLKTWDSANNAAWWATPDGTYNNGSWYHLVLYWNASHYLNNSVDPILFINGRQATFTGDGTGGALNPDNSTWFDIGGSPGGGQNFDGMLDEVRISVGQRSGAFIRTQYNNQRPDNAFLSVAAEERQGLTDADGRFAYTLKAPGVPGVYPIIVNSTYNGEYARQDLTLIVYEFPHIRRNWTVPVPYYNASVVLYANVTDDNIRSVNFTIVRSDGSTVLSAENGTRTGTVWSASAVTLDLIGRWNYTIHAVDLDNNTDTLQGQFRFLDIDVDLEPPRADLNASVAVSGQVRDSLAAPVPGVAVGIYRNGTWAVPAWIEGYRYRRPMALNGSTNLSDFQMNITLDTASLVSSGKLRSDCADIRMANASGEPMPYWVEACNTTYTQVWTKMNLTAGQNATIYLFYGNPEAADASNGSATFVFFDGFDAQDDRWQSTGSAGSMSWVNSTNGTELKLDGPSSSGNAYKAVYNQSYSLGDGLVAVMALRSTNDVGGGLSNSTSMATTWYSGWYGGHLFGNSNNNYYLSYSSSTINTAKSFSASQRYVLRDTINSSTVNATVYANGTQYVSLQQGGLSVPGTLYPTLESYDVAYADYYYLRKHAPSMPAVTAGSEQNLSTDGSGRYNISIASPASEGSYLIMVNGSSAGEYGQSARVLTTRLFPKINSNTTVGLAYLGAVIQLRANVTDDNLAGVNFTVTAPNGTIIISSVNGTSIGDLWDSPAFNLTSVGRWNFTIYAYDADGTNGTYHGQVRFLDVQSVLIPSTSNVAGEVMVVGNISLSDGSPAVNESLTIYVNGSLQASIGSGYRYRIPVNFSEPVGRARDNEHVLIDVAIPADRVQDENTTALFCGGVRMPFDAYATNTADGEVRALRGLAELNFTAYENKSCYLYYGNALSVELVPNVTGWGYVGDTNTVGATDDIVLGQEECTGQDADGEFTTICGVNGDNMEQNQWCYWKGQTTGMQSFGIHSDDTSWFHFNSTLVLSTGYWAGWVSSSNSSTTTGRYYLLETDWQESGGGQFVVMAHNTADNNNIDTECYPFLGDEWMINYSVGTESPSMLTNGTGGFNYSIQAPATLGTYEVIVNATIGREYGQASAALQVFDITPPVRLDPGALNNSVIPGLNTSPTISLGTDESAFCQYSTNISFVYGEGTNFSGGQGGVNHTFTYANVTSGSWYNVSVKCEDLVGNENPDDWYVTFRVNWPTNITLFSLTNPAYDINDLVCGINITDYDNTTINAEYAWYKYSGGSFVLNLTGNRTGLANGTFSNITTLGAGNTSIGDIWNCSVRVYDGIEYSPWSSARTTIENLTSENITASGVLERWFITAEGNDYTRTNSSDNTRHNFYMRYPGGYLTYNLTLPSLYNVSGGWNLTSLELLFEGYQMGYNRHIFEAYNYTSSSWVLLDSDLPVDSEQLRSYDLTARFTDLVSKDGTVLVRFNHSYNGDYNTDQRQVIVDYLALRANASDSAPLRYTNGTYGYRYAYIDNVQERWHIAGESGTYNSTNASDDGRHNYWMRWTGGYLTYRMPVPQAYKVDGDWNLTRLDLVIEGYQWAYNRHVLQVYDHTTSNWTDVDPAFTTGEWPMVYPLIGNFSRVVNQDGMVLVRFLHNNAGDYDYDQRQVSIDYMVLRAVQDGNAQLRAPVNSTFSYNYSYADAAPEKLFLTAESNNYNATWVSDNTYQSYYMKHQGGYLMYNISVPSALRVGDAYNLTTLQLHVEGWQWGYNRHVLQAYNYSSSSWVDVDTSFSTAQWPHEYNMTTRFWGIVNQDGVMLLRFMHNNAGDYDYDQRQVSVDSIVLRATSDSNAALYPIVNGSYDYNYSYVRNVPDRVHIVGESGLYNYTWSSDNTRHSFYMQHQYGYLVYNLTLPSFHNLSDGWNLTELQLYIEGYQWAYNRHVLQIYNYSSSAWMDLDTNYQTGEYMQLHNLTGMFSSVVNRDGQILIRFMHNNAGDYNYDQRQVSMDYIMLRAFHDSNAALRAPANASSYSYAYGSVIGVHEYWDIMAQSGSYSSTNNSDDTRHSFYMRQPYGYLIYNISMPDEFKVGDTYNITAAQLTIEEYQWAYNRHSVQLYNFTGSRWMDLETDVPTSEVSRDYNFTSYFSDVVNDDGRMLMRAYHFHSTDHAYDQRQQTIDHVRVRLFNDVNAQLRPAASGMYDYDHTNITGLAGTSNVVLYGGVVNTTASDNVYHAYYMTAQYGYVAYAFNMSDKFRIGNGWNLSSFEFMAEWWQNYNNIHGLQIYDFQNKNWTTIESGWGGDNERQGYYPLAPNFTRYVHLNGSMFVRFYHITNYDLNSDQRRVFVDDLRLRTIRAPNATYHAGYNAPMTVSMLAPENNSIVPSAGFDVVLNASDEDSVIVNCSLYVDGIFNRTNTTIVQAQNVTFGLLLAEGLHTLEAFCADDSPSPVWYSGGVYTVNVTSMPALYVLSPINMTYYTPTIVLNYTVTDYEGVSACWYTDPSGTNVTLPGCQNSTFTVAAGYQSITVYANDTLGNVASVTRFFTMNLRPNVTIISPQNTTYLDQNVSLNYTATDSDGISACMVELNGMNMSYPACSNTTLTYVHMNDSSKLLAVDFAEGSGTVTYDRSPQRRVLNASRVVWNSSSRFGNGISFDNNNDRAPFVSGVAINGSSFTLSGWARRAAAGGNDLLIGQGTGSGNNGLHFGFRSDNRFACAFYSNDLDTTTTYTDTNWHHWVCTYNVTSGLRILYRDGVQIANNTGSAYTGTGDLYIGRVPWDASYWNFNGDLDEIAIFNRSFTAADVSRIYRQQAIKGTNTLRVYANDTLGVWGYADANFTVNDRPVVNLTSPTNGTYQNSTVAVNFSSSEEDAPLVCMLELNGRNMSYPVCANTTLTYAHYNNSAAVLALDFAEGAGNITYDRSAYRNNGSLTATTWGAGRFGSGVAFNGSAQIDVPDRDYFSPAVNNITLAVWARIPGNATPLGNGACGTQGRNLVAKGNTNNWEWALENDNNNLLCFVLWDLSGSVGHAILTSSRAMNDSEWHFYTASVGYNRNVTLYVDGVQVASTATFSGSMGNGSQGVQIGRRGDGNYFIGDIDEVVIFNRSMSRNEVLQLYEERVATGYQTIAVHVQDAYGAWGYANVTYNIMTSAGPNITIISPQNTSYATSAVNLTYTVQDNEGVSTCVVELDGVNMSYPHCSNTTFTYVHYNDTGDVASFDFAEGSGTVAYDRGPSMAGRAITNAQYNASGKYGSCLAFDGSGDYFDVAVPAMVNYTYEAWIKVRTVSEGDYLVDRTTASSELASLMISGGRFAHQYRDNAGAGLTNLQGGVITQNAWHHVVWGRRYGQEFFIYVDGNKTNASDSLGALTPPTPRFGTHVYGSGVNMLMDEIAIYNRSLSDAEVLAHYRGTGYLGNHTLRVFANDTTNVWNSSAVNYTISDVPSVNISSPQNATYANSTINLTYTATDTDGISACVVELDGYNMSYPLCSNTTLTYVHYNDSGKVLALDFAEGTGSVTQDRSTNARVATISGAQWNSSGRYGSALTFTGSAYANLSHNVFAGATNITIAVWVRSSNTIPSDGNYRVVAGSSGTGSEAEIDGYLQIAKDSGTKRVEFVYYNGGWKIARATADVDDGYWHHVAVTHVDGVADRIYVDGVEFAVDYRLGSVSTLAHPAAAKTVIGRMNRGGGEGYYVGSIDEVVIFNRSLNTTEIAALYRGLGYRGNHTLRVHASDTYGVWNSSAVNFTVSTDSCTPVAGQPWTLDLADNCVISGLNVSVTSWTIMSSGGGNVTIASSNISYQNRTVGSISGDARLTYLTDVILRGG